MSETPTKPNLTPGAQRLVDAVRQKNDPAAIEEWLLVLMERHGPMAEGLCAEVGAADLVQHLPGIIKQGQVSERFEADAFITLAVARAQERGKEQASERDLAVIILLAAGYVLLPDATAGTSSVMSSSAAPTTGSAEPQAAGQGQEAAWQPRAKRPTPALDKLGQDVTRAAQQGKTPPLVGREEEIRMVIETLCRRTKRNPVLVGPAGVGKTAIVEGLAARIVAGKVPDLLRGTRVVSLQRSALIGGAQHGGDVAGRIQSILKEAAQDGIVLFIDELHAFMDFADDLKPALARGDVACIGATTDDEYRQFVESDRALERRFQPLRIQALSPEQTLGVLESLRDTLARDRGVSVEEDVLAHLVDLAEQFMRNRYFPDKAVDLFEQCVAYALSEGKTALDRADADHVVQRLIGMPLSSEERLHTLQAFLSERSLLSESDAAALCTRLAVTLGNFDLNPERPNATMLLLGSAARNAEVLARAAAMTLYGGEDRTVVIDFGLMRQEHDLSILIGSPPGYVGYSQRLPLHQIAQMPWCVLVCANVDHCHPTIRAVLAQGLATGQITDAAGKRIYLSDTLVVLTVASAETAAPRAMGFRHEPDPAEDAAADAASHDDLRSHVATLIGADLADECDLIFSAPHASGTATGGEGLLADLRERYLREKLHLNWDPGVVAWLKSHESRCRSARDWERLLDERLTPLLTPYRAHRPGDDLHLTITTDGTVLRVTPQPPPQGQTAPDPLSAQPTRKTPTTKAER